MRRRRPCYEFIDLLALLPRVLIGRVAVFFGNLDGLLGLKGVFSPVALAPHNFIA